MIDFLLKADGRARHFTTKDVTMPSRIRHSIHVSSEFAPLRRLLVHSPDSGLGKVVPSKAQDWLFEDIVHLPTIRKGEYDYYIKLLMYFLDPDRIRGRLHEIDQPDADRGFYKPGNPQFHASDKVVELQTLLTDILKDEHIRLQLVSSVCAIEGCTFETQQKLLSVPPADLSKVFITGTSDEDHMIFPPLPNLIFTRDIGIVINDHILLNRPARKARMREALIMKYIFFHHPVFESCRERILEIPETFRHFLLPRDTEEGIATLEGGDVMVVAPGHLLIGVSERTTLEAAHHTINLLFDRNIIRKITIIKIPKKRDYMHIDTVFTQVKRNVWVMLGHFSRKNIKRAYADGVQRILFEKKKDEKLDIIQFDRKSPSDPSYFNNLEDLLDDISRNDLGSKEKTRFIYSGNNEFPYDAREQWTDSCNLLALRDGVVLGYDRNDRTIEAFRKEGFEVVDVKSLLEDFEAGRKDPQTMEDTLILMPSAELSRARGGFHCMSMPLLRDIL
jgi:arginine deiminase